MNKMLDETEECCDYTLNDLPIEFDFRNRSNSKNNYF